MFYWLSVTILKKNYRAVVLAASDSYFLNCVLLGKYKQLIAFFVLNLLNLTKSGLAEVLGHTRVPFLAFEHFSAVSCRLGNTNTICQARCPQVFVNIAF